MQTLGLNLRSKGPTGEKLPVVFEQLGVYGAHIRRGQLSLIGAGSGVGKSSLITFVSMAMGEAVPTLYFSADSDVATFGIRVGAMAARELTHKVEAKVMAKDPDMLSVIESKTDHMWVSFDSSPSPRDISDEVDIFGMIRGEYPSLIVVDNLMDVPTGGMDERGGQDAVLDFLKQLARRTQAAVVVLCHVTGEFANGNVPIPLNGLMNKIDKRPRLVLTLHNFDTNVLGVSIVKNSNGRADPSGNLVVAIPYIKETMYFGRGKPGDH